MSVTIVQIYERLRNILSDLDAQQLHLPAIYVAKAIEVIEVNHSEEFPTSGAILLNPNEDPVAQAKKIRWSGELSGN